MRGISSIEFDTASAVYGTRWRSGAKVMQGGSFKNDKMELM